MLRKPIPLRLCFVSGRTGGIVKISTGTPDRAEAKRRWPGVLAKSAATEPEWERMAAALAVTPQIAATIAAVWAA